jgi:hypothetical protein
MLGKAFDEGITRRRATQGGEPCTTLLLAMTSTLGIMLHCAFIQAFFGGRGRNVMFSQRTLNTPNNLHVHLTQIEHTILHNSTTCCSFTKH